MRVLTELCGPEGLNTLPRSWWSVGCGPPPGGGQAVDQDEGPYGAEGYIRQAVAPLPEFNGNYMVLGSWFAGGQACGLSVREDASPITKNTSRFLPHAIIG